jgi:hypothetical protein
MQKLFVFYAGVMSKSNRYLDEHNKRYYKPSKYFEVKEKCLSKKICCMLEIDEMVGHVYRIWFVKF